MTVQIIASKDIENTSVEEMSEYLDETIIRYLNTHGWIIDNISSI